MHLLKYIESFYSIGSIFIREQETYEAKSAFFIIFFLTRHML